MTSPSTAQEHPQTATGHALENRFSGVSAETRDLSVHLRRAPAPHPAPPAPFHPAAGPTSRSSGKLAGGLVSLLGGGGLALLGVLMLIAPFGLFLLGGGGNTTSFLDDMTGIWIMGFLCLAIAAAAVIFGIVLIATSRRPRA